MTAVDTIARDLESLSAAATEAARLGDWDALQRYERVRLLLVTGLGALAADATLRDTAVMALHHAQLLGVGIGVAMDGARVRQDEQAETVLRLDRAGRAYANASTA